MTLTHAKWNPRRVVPAALLAAALVALSGCTSKELASDLGESEAQEAVVTLQQHGVVADKIRVGKGKDATWTLVVPSGQALQANQILQRYELPRKRPLGFAGVFGSTGLIPTATEEKARLLMALQGEISHTLETVSGVVGARVHIVLPERDPLSSQAQSPASAGVYLKYRGDQLPLTHDEVKLIVAHAVDGLEAERVIVVMKPIQIDQAELAALARTTGGLLTAEQARLFVFVLAGLCVVLAAILVFLVLRLQKEKQQTLVLRRELSVRAAEAVTKG